MFKSKRPRKIIMGSFKDSRLDHQSTWYQCLFLSCTTDVIFILEHDNNVDIVVRGENTACVPKSAATRSVGVV